MYYVDRMAFFRLDSISLSLSLYCMYIVNRNQDVAGYFRSHIAKWLWTLRLLENQIRQQPQQPDTTQQSPISVLYTRLLNFVPEGTIDQYDDPGVMSSEDSDSDSDNNNLVPEASD